MKNLSILVAFVLIFACGCQKENSTESKSEKIKLLTQGIWEISNDSEVGQIGVQIRYYEDGRYQIRESVSSDWLPDNLTWTMSDDGEELTMNGTNALGTFDKFKIMELTSSKCIGKILNSSTSIVIGKIVRLFKAIQ